MKLGEQMHRWYLEATKYLDPDSFNAKAQIPYDLLTEQQRSIDGYIANKVRELFIEILDTTDVLGPEHPQTNLWYRDLKKRIEQL